MVLVCVDGDGGALEHTLSLCRAHSCVDRAVGFTDTEEALAWFDMDRADLALLDAGCFALAAKLRERYTKLPLFFLSTDASRALDAFAYHPFTYLLKPLDPGRLDHELNQLLLSRANEDVSHVMAQTFGVFSLTVDGREVRFDRARSRELLALLIDRRGGAVSRKIAFLEMWEDREYDARSQNYFNVIVNSLRDTLKAYGISEIFEMSGGYMRVRPELIDCDLYRYLRGDSDANAAFRGIYLYGYSWAVWGEGY